MHLKKERERERDAQKKFNIFQLVICKSGQCNQALASRVVVCVREYDAEPIDKKRGEETKKMKNWLDASNRLHIIIFFSFRKIEMKFSLDYFFLLCCCCFEIGVTPEKKNSKKQSQRELSKILF